ncbi:hypothetical protein MASR2M15_04850 [Anaerolineales bacterium]
MTEFNISTEVKLEVSVHIRKAKEEDIRKLEWHGEYTKYRLLFERSYQEMLAGKRILLIAEMNHYPIGRLFIQLKSAFPRIADGRSSAYLYSFQVMDIFQNMGIGSQLLFTAESLLCSRKFRQVTLAVAKDNEKATNFYLKHHYHHFAEDPGKWEYIDHEGLKQLIEEPSWLLRKQL